MATRADVEEFAQANRDIRALLLLALADWWRSVNVADPKAAAAQAVGVLPELVAAYGELAASVAADFYDRLRVESGAPGRYTAAMADPPPVEAVEANARWAVGPLFHRTEPVYRYDELTGEEVPAGQRDIPPDPPAALARLEQVADAAVQQQGRDTIDLNTGRDPADARWARVPTGESTCAFCLALASRGAVYRSAVTAGDKEKGGKEFHARDDCQAIPMWPGDDYPEGYDPDAMYQQYLDARKAAGTGEWKPILAKLRELNPNITH